MKLTYDPGIPSLPGSTIYKSKAYNITGSPSSVRSLQIKSKEPFSPLEVLGVRTSRIATDGGLHKFTAPRPHQITSDCLSGAHKELLKQVSFSASVPKTNDSSLQDDDIVLPWDTRHSAKLNKKKIIHEPEAKIKPSGDGKFHFRTLPVRWKVRLNDSNGATHYSLLDNCSGLSLIDE